MTITADLAPGDMLVLGSLPSGRAAWATTSSPRSDDRLEQKLLIVRLSQTQHDGLFNPPEPLKLEE